MSPSLRSLYFLLLILLNQTCIASTVTHHDLSVTLQPSKGKIEVEDVISLQNKTTQIIFTLHRNLKIKPSPNVTITPIDAYDRMTPVPVQRYQAKLTHPGNQLKLHYSGTIEHSLQQISEDYAGDLTQTPGLISSDGVYLSANSYWFPRTDSDYLSFSMQTQLPEGWHSISQGRQIENGWEETSSQDDIYIIAAPYQIYQRKTPNAEAMVYLRSADSTMANQYLDATEHYLALYSKLLGSYPYAKFALVENFWETGYGMPSFTLLGPTVIRLPFIIHTSYPHEILHNWWGNSVYPDYASGNWSEGLTSYLADHLIQEQSGMGADYRRTTLQRYADSVKGQQDFPLTAFQSRHGEASQAIGYGKTMMFFHMLRQQLGDAVFIEGLRYFYKNNIFKIADFSALQSAFEFVSKKDLGTEFRQWTTRTGAPSLKLSNVAIKKTTAGYTLTATVTQIQTGTAFSLHIPIYIQLDGKNEYTRHIVSMNKKTETLSLSFDKQPLRIKLDPQFDLFRQLDPSEIPSSFAQLFGADKVLIILSSKDTNEMKAAYKELANNWAQRSATLSIVWDTEIKNLPTDQAIWLLGESNIFLKSVKNSLKSELFNYNTEQFVLNKKEFSTTDHSFATTTPNPFNKQQTIGWVSVHSPETVSHLFRKLPHYKKYSYLVFKGDSVRNIYKGKWPLEESALNFTTHENNITPDLELVSPPALTQIIQESSKN